MCRSFIWSHGCRGFFAIDGALKNIKASLPCAGALFGPMAVRVFRHRRAFKNIKSFLPCAGVNLGMAIRAFRHEARLKNNKLAMCRDVYGFYVIRHEEIKNLHGINVPTMDKKMIKKSRKYEDFWNLKFKLFTPEVYVRSPKITGWEKRQSLSNSIKKKLVAFKVAAPGHF